MRSTRDTPLAFTLVELMVSIALIALAASIGAMGLASTGEAATFERDAAIALNADRSARALAAEHGPVRLEVAAGGARLALIPRAAESSSRAFDLASGNRIDLVESRAERPLDAVRYDSRGRCDDFYIRIRSGNRTRTWHIAGLTGWADLRELPIP